MMYTPCHRTEIKVAHTNGVQLDWEYLDTPEQGFLDIASDWILITTHRLHQGGDWLNDVPDAKLCQHKNDSVDSEAEKHCEQKI